MSTSTATGKELLGKILESVFYKKALGKAPRIAKNASSLLKLLKQALEKTQTLGVGGIYDEIRSKIVLLGELLKAYASGEYRQIELGNVLKVVAAFIYFISPLDIIPDIIPMIGFTDDVALLLFIVKSIGDELDKFEIWKTLNK